MSKADDAYITAQRMIAEVLESGGGILDLDTEETHALATLPPEISDLTGLAALWLYNTQITVDLSRNCAAPLTAYYTQKENENGNETISRVSTRSGAGCADQWTYAKAGSC